MWRRMGQTHPCWSKLLPHCKAGFHSGSAALLFFLGWLKAFLGNVGLVRAQVWGHSVTSGGAVSAQVLVRAQPLAGREAARRAVPSSPFPLQAFML